MYQGKFASKNRGQARTNEPNVAADLEKELNIPEDILTEEEAPAAQAPVVETRVVEAPAVEAAPVEETAPAAEEAPKKKKKKKQAPVEEAPVNEKPAKKKGKKKSLKSNKEETQKREDNAQNGVDKEGGLPSNNQKKSSIKRQKIPTSGPSTSLNISFHTLAEAPLHQN